MLTTLLELFGVLALTVFAWFVWAPLPLAVAGSAALAASWRIEVAKRRPGRGGAA